METVSRVLNTTVFSMGDGPGITVLQIAIALLTLLIGFWLARGAERALSKRLEQRNVDASVVQPIRRLFYIVVIVVLFFTTLGLLGIPLAAFAFVTGAIAIGVGFGAKNIINNFISGWILMWERPIRIGDFLELGNMLGTVESIHTRFTRLRRIDGVRMMIPNSQLLENTVVNWTIVDRQLRSSVRVGVRYGSDVQKVRRLLDEILANNPDILEDPAPVVIFEDFGDSALIFDAFFWIESTKERTLRGVRSALRFEIDRVFKENDLVIAFPQRDIHVDGSLKLEKP
ncbi:MAG: mechanosensitive ion channel [Betaproteobacteria bacterium]|nr:MAG: mechanosensitive ion channel [Betaproteobacteria bacterium]